MFSDECGCLRVSVAEGRSDVDAVWSVFERGFEVSGTFCRAVSVGLVTDAFGETVLLPSCECGAVRFSGA